MLPLEQMGPPVGECSGAMVAVCSVWRLLSTEASSSMESGDVYELGCPPCVAPGKGGPGEARKDDVLAAHGRGSRSFGVSVASKGLRGGCRGSVRGFGTMHRSDALLWMPVLSPSVELV